MRHAQSACATNPCIVHVKPGMYKELIHVQREKGFVHLVGEDAAKTVLTYGLIRQNCRGWTANRSAHFARHRR